MPDEPALEQAPTESEIHEYLALRGPRLHASAGELLRDPDLARQILGQQQIFEELAEFERIHGFETQVRFLPWPDAFRFFADYVSAQNPPVVAQIGDTWAAFFRSQGVLAGEERHTWDVRLLW